MLEGILSRGDRRLAGVIRHAWHLGSKFDAWSEHFSYDRWEKAFHECELSPQFYAFRERPLDEVLPWAHISSGISPDYFKGEYERAMLGRKTPNCSTGRCNLCGLQESQALCQEKLREITNALK